MSKLIDLTGQRFGKLMVIGRADSRKDVNGNYTPDNCRWIPMDKQADNKSNSRLFEYNGEAHTVSEWSKIFGISRDIIWNRIKRGWDIERVFTQPIRKW